jgi:hypothetical protein
MKLSNIALSVLLTLVATSAFAGKKEKEFVCHVGSEYGPDGEVYMDDPGCVPNDGNDFFCPDAGKIDLIEVPNTAKHINNPSHTFVEEIEEGVFVSVSDYLPDPEWIARGNVDENPINGIDDGCEEPPPPAEVCPCWDEGDLELVTNANKESGSCWSGSYPETSFSATIESNFVYFGGGTDVEQSSRCYAWDFNPVLVDPDSCDESEGSCLGESLPLDEATASICYQQLVARCDVIMADNEE